MSSLVCASHVYNHTSRAYDLQICAWYMQTTCVSSSLFPIHIFPLSRNHKVDMNVYFLFLQKYEIVEKYTLWFGQKAVAFFQFFQKRSV